MYTYKLKRVLDITLSVIGLILLSPLFLLLMLAIFIDNPGPVFYRQTRVGYKGKHFKVWKFRTMITDAEQLITNYEYLNQSKNPILFKIKGADPRVTRIGNLLRSSSLDELPQLFNVLMGELSLVGPRCYSLRDWNLMPPECHDRADVPQGIVCFWQIYPGDRWDLSFEEVYNLDMKYVNLLKYGQWSIFTDLSIILKAVFIVLKRSNC